MAGCVYSLLFAIIYLYESGSPVNGLLGGAIVPVDTSVVPAVPTGNASELPNVPTGLPELPALCLIEALKASGELLVKSGMLMCMYNSGPETLNNENWNSLFEAFEETLVKTLCVVDDALNIDLLQKLGTPTSELVKVIAKQLVPILDKAGLTPKLMNTLCGLLEPALTPSCLPSLLAENVVKLILDMKLQVCLGKNEHLLYEDLAAILAKLSCVLKCPAELPSLPAGEIPELPSLPAVPNADEIPELPGLPAVPNAGEIPQLPSLPAVPNADDIPKLPSVPAVPIDGDIPVNPPLPEVPSDAGVPGVPDHSQSNAPEVPKTIVKRQIGGTSSLLNIPIAAPVPPVVPVPNTDPEPPAVPEIDPVPEPVANDSLPVVPEIPQEGPSDIVAKVTCTAFNLLLDQVVQVPV